MSVHGRLRTEHAGAKNRRGYWGPRADAKAISRKVRRWRARQLCRQELIG